ncbi:uncharacterized protein J4E92_009073 [Alternaria infectoria]|uniref:uncharacterized protein n=1 Tax=Alternaria infectoria TaxID=45303 RepID=UPI0022204108|nr:uncharacterized protein J4E92_009073 [Alternaria infectoria]KAI4916569.1 hypothetical protein J4E92_009073 [Alternaria infectoria]
MRKSKVNENESRLRRERDAALCTVGEQKRKLNNLYTKIGQLWEENDALKENITALKDQEKSTEELCGACRLKDAEIAQLHEQLDSAGELSEESKTIGSRTQECNLALSMKTNELFTTAVEAKTDPDEDAAQAGLRIAYFKAEEELRTKDLAHAAEMAKIKEEHSIVATRLHEEVRDAHTATNKEHAEKLYTQEQLSKITQKLSDTKKQLFYSEEQYRILYDIIPKPGGGRMAKPPPPIMAQSSQRGDLDVSGSSVPLSSRLRSRDRSLVSHSQDQETSLTPSHVFNDSEIDQDQDFLAGSETPPTFTLNKRTHKLDQDQSSAQRAKKRRGKSFFTQPGKNEVFTADDIPWLFCVAGEGGISYHKLDELSPDAQERLTADFQFWFSASNHVQYTRADRSRHNTYARMVKEGFRLANVGRGCVQTRVLAKGKVSQQIGEHEACSPCQNKGCPCAKMIIHNENLVLCWYRQGSGASSGTTWQDAAYWVRKRPSTIDSSQLSEELDVNSSR